MRKLAQKGQKKLIKAERAIEALSLIILNGKGVGDEDCRMRMAVSCTKIKEAIEDGHRDILKALNDAGGTVGGGDKNDP